MPTSYPAEFRRRAIALVRSGWSVTKTAHDDCERPAYRTRCQNLRKNWIGIFLIGGDVAESESVSLDDLSHFNIYRRTEAGAVPNEGVELTVLTAWVGAFG
jgi:hypothetical protein